MIALIAIFVVLLNRTKFGTYIYAIGGNRESARLSGVPIKRVEIVTFTISGLLAAFAGLVLSARMFSGQPSVGIGYELDAIAACVLGRRLAERRHRPDQRNVLRRDRHRHYQQRIGAHQRRARFGSSSSKASSS